MRQEKIMLKTKQILAHFVNANWSFEYTNRKGQDIEEAISYLESFDFNNLAGKIDLDSQDADVEMLDNICGLVADEIVQLALSDKDFSIDESVTFIATF